MEIVCTCGHRIKDHDDKTEGCWYHFFGGSCYCTLSPETVEARYWAREMKKGLDTAINALEQTAGNINRTQDYPDNIAVYNDIQFVLNKLRYNEIVCPNCGGVGKVYWTGIVGYISHDMAMDTGDMDYEGQPQYGVVHEQCPRCEGSGHIKGE